MKSQVVELLQIVNLVRERKTEAIFRGILSATREMSCDEGDQRYRSLLALWRSQLKKSAPAVVISELYAEGLTDRKRKKIHSARGFSAPAAELWSAFLTLDARGAEANTIRKAALQNPDFASLADAFIHENPNALDANSLLREARRVEKQGNVKA